VLGIGLIGLGKHGSRYARHIAEHLTDAALVAVCRRNRTEGEKLAAASGCEFHVDYRDLFANPRVDAVVVAVPPTLHPAIVEAACQAGKSLLVEKPLATSLAEATRISRMLSVSGVRAMVAHTLRRKMKMTLTTSAIVKARVSCTSWTEARIVCVRSLRTETLMAGGIAAVS